MSHMYVLIYNETMSNTIVNVTEARDNFAEILGRVRFGGEIVTVEKKGRLLSGSGVVGFWSGNQGGDESTK